MSGGTGTERHVGVAGGVDHPARADRLAPRLRLGDDADHSVAIHDRCGERAVQHAVDAGFLDQAVGHQLEALRIELVRLRLALLHGGTHLEGARLELAADAVGLDGVLVAIPGHAFDADSGDVAAVAPEALDERHLRTRTRRAQRGGQRELLRHALGERFDLFAFDFAEAVIGQQPIGSFERLPCRRAFEARQVRNG